ncbi:AAA family ATPase [bacterium]|nr:AAA family ATPase [bacterium]
MNETQKALEFLKKFFSNYENKDFYIEFRIFGKRGMVDRHFIEYRDLMEKPIEIEKIIEKYIKGHNFYFGVLPRYIKSGKKEGLRKGSVVWLDIDFHDEPIVDNLEEKIIQKYNEFIETLNNIGVPKPNISIYSGKGFQVYWLLDKEIDYDLIGDINEKLANFLKEKIKNIDTNAKDPTRIMRLPYSENVKYEKHLKTKIIFENYIQIPGNYFIEFISKITTKSIKKIEQKDDIFTRRLGSKTRLRIAEWFSNFWIKGYRNQMEMYFSGLMIKNGIKLEHAEQILKKICEITNDEEITSRIKNLEYHYNHRKELNEKLKSSKGISEVIWKIINNINEEEAKNNLELYKLYKQFRDGILLPDDVDHYVNSVLRTFYLKRNIFEETQLDVVNIKDLLNMDVSLPEFITRPFIPKQSLIILGGKPESFKSIFTLILSINIASGTKFLNIFETKRGKVLYVDAENGKIETARRIKYFFKNIVDADFDYLQFKSFKELDKILKNDYDLVVFDSFRRFLRGNETDSQVVNDFYMNYLKPLKEKGTSIILIHHFRKKRGDITDEDLQEMFRGSTDIIAMIDLAYALEKVEEKVDIENSVSEYIINFRKAKNRLGIPIVDFSFRIIKNDKEQRSRIEFIKLERVLTLEDRIKEEIVSILKEAKDVMKRSEIKDKLEERIGEEINKNTLTRALNSLVLIGSIVKEKYGHYKINEKLLERWFDDRPEMEEN